jgi:HK97 family phage portal protein
MIWRAFRAAPPRGSSNPLLALLTSAFGGRAADGELVTVDTAMRVAAVYACVSLISRTIAALPLHVYERTRAGGRVLMRTPSTEFLWRRPNPEMTRTEFWEGAIAHAVLEGNAFIYVAPATNISGRRPAELWPLDSSRVAIGGRDSQGRMTYVIDGTTPQLSWSQGGNILHIRGLTLDGVSGVSPIAVAATSIRTAYLSAQSAARIMGSGGIPSGVLTIADRITQEEADRIAAEFEARHGDRRSVLVLNREANWKPVAISPDDMQAIDTRRFEVVDIARVFGVPPEMIGAGSESASLTYANVQDRMIQFTQLSLQPWIARIEQAVSDELLPAAQYAKFDLRGLLRGNSEQRVRYYSVLAGLGALTVNEIRELEDMPALEGS